MDYNDELSLNSSVNTSQYAAYTDIKESSLHQHLSSTTVSTGIHVAVRRTTTPNGLRTREQSYARAPSAPVHDDNESDSEYSVGIVTVPKARHSSQRKKPPIIVPGKKKSRAPPPPASTLWSTGTDDDMHHLEEKYRMAVHEAKLNSESSREKLFAHDAAVMSRAPSFARPGETMAAATLDRRMSERGVDSGTAPESDQSLSAPPVEEVAPPPVEEEKPKSKAKNKLKNLNKFVLGHTARKLTSNWDLVENKFQASLTHDVVIVKGANGIGNPVKIKTLPLSSLTLLLCSAQLQLKHKELLTLYTTMKYSPTDVEQSCKIAARKLVLSASANPEVQLQCQDEIAELLVDGEPNIRIDTLLENVFSSDPEDRKKEMEELEKARAERVSKLTEEKKRKKENIEKAEKRKQKSKHDFENSLSGVQYPRGVINEKRLQHLRGTIDFAYDILLEEFYEKSAAVDPFVIDLLGAEMFPTQDGDLPSHIASKEDAKDAAFQKAGFVRKQLVEDSKRIDMVGPPSIVELLRRAVALGKGLYGTSFNDVVELLQAYSATRMQAAYRGFTRRWRYRVARRAWKHLYNFMKSKIFKAWAGEMMMMKNLRECCFRKLTAWKHYTKKNIRRRYKFRVCYWPFYVWRRHAIETARAREKSKFLVGRVYPTYKMLSTFRGWKRYYLEESHFNKPADAFYRTLLRKNMGVSLQWWRYWLRRRKGLRRAWIEKGYMMRCIKLEDCIRVPFQLWRAATTFKLRTVEFVKKNTHKMRQFIFPDIAIHLPPIKIRLSAEDKKKLLEEVTLAEGSNSGTDSLHTKRDRQMAKAKLNALKRLKTTGDADASAKTVPIHQLQLFASTMQGKFSWKPDPVRFDIQSNKDEVVSTSETFHLLYEAYCRAHPEAVDTRYELLDYGIKWGTIRNHTKFLVDEMRDRFFEVQIWNAFESACIYQRKAHRCFQNLQQFAKVSKNAKKTKHQYRDNLLRKCLYAFLKWATRGLDDCHDDADGAVHISKAEEMAFRSRTTRMEKLKKRRDVAKAFKDRDAAFREKELEVEAKIMEELTAGSKDMSSSDVGPRARQRRLSMEFKRISAVVKATPSAEQGSTAMNMMNELVSSIDGEDAFDTVDSAITENSYPSFNIDPLSITSGIPFQEEDSPGSKANDSFSRGTGVTTPATGRTADTSITADIDLDNIDMLEWDRRDRDEEMDLMQEMMQYGKEMASSTRKKVRQVAREAAKASTVNETRENMMNKVFENEAKRTEYSINKEMEYVDTFKLRMAGNMVNVLLKVYDELMEAFMESQKRHYFRRLRLPLLMSRSKAMCNRKKMSNWIRICNRLGNLYEKAPIFRNMKLKWTIFNRWLKYYEKENLDCSSGLIDEIKLRTRKRKCLSDHLRSRGIVNTVYPRRGSLMKVGLEFKTIFLRWKEFTQDSLALKLMSVKAKALHRVRILEKCFWSIKTNISLKRSYDIRKSSHSYAYVRAVSDTEQVSKRYFALRRRSLSNILTWYQHKAQRLLRKGALKEVTFKRFVHYVDVDVSSRLMTEQKLLLSAFERRGTASYKDVKVATKMNKSPGDRFNDPRVSERYVDVPPGYLITKIKIAVQMGLGVVGWQLFWGADGCSPMEGTPRGKMIGSGLSELEYIIKPNDYLVEVEYVSEGAVMTGIRFRTFFGSWSKFFGSKPNQLSKKFRLSCDMATLPDGEAEYTVGGRREEMAPGYPWNYIIGFGGIETPTRATCLSAVVRKIQTQNVFTYHFVNEAPSMVKMPRSDFSEDGGESEEGELPPVDGSSTLSSTLSRPTSSNTTNIGVRNAKLAKHLADLQTLLPFYDDGSMDYVPEPPVTLTNSEEQFFDVIRMRIVEVKSAQARALNFARSVWTSMAFQRNSTTKPMTTIKVLTGLAKWFLEALCKNLVVCPVGSEAANVMFAEAHTCDVQVEILENRITSYNSSIHTLEASERSKPWYGKPLLGPQLRDQKGAFQGELKDLKDTRAGLQLKRHENMARADLLREAAVLLLPRFQLSQTVCRNFRMKIAGARYKSNLLEKMTMESLKEHLGGGKSSMQNYTFSLSDADQEKLRKNKMIAESAEPSLGALDSLFEEEAAVEEVKNARQQMYAKGGTVSFADSDRVLPSLTKKTARELTTHSKVPNAVPNRILTNDDFSHTSTQKKTFRKSVAVNPVWGSVSSRRPASQHSKTMPAIHSRKLQSS